MSAHVLRALAQCRTHFPELRTLQVIFNSLDMKGLARNPNGTARNLFYVTDEVLVDALESYLALKWVPRANPFDPIPVSEGGVVEMKRRSPPPAGEKA